MYSSFRPSTDTIDQRLVLVPETLTLDNYRNAWKEGDMRSHFCKTAFIVLPALVLTLFFASMVAFVCTRYSWRFNIVLPRVVHRRQPDAAAGDLPAAVPDLQAGAAARLSLERHGQPARQKIAVILIHVAFQIGFCTFVLCNYMKTIPK